MPIDYSKWKEIEVSDDEDDTHPNVDTPSLFRWRHQARLQRQTDFAERKQATEEELRKAELKLQKTKDASNLSQMKTSLLEVEKSAIDAREKMSQINKEERLQPWNVDTISKDGFSKSHITKMLPFRKDNYATDEERENSMRSFVQKNEKEIKEFGLLRKFRDSKQYLMDNRQHLACEETANYLVIWCINLALDEKFSLMDHVSHQCIAMQYLLELAQQLNCDPRSCISSFFSKIEQAEVVYKKAFDDELAAFRIRIRRRAEQKIAEQMAELEAEERSKRLGPGGLDPLEVLEELPSDLRECFETKEVGRLQEVIRSMPDAEARKYMKMCIDSGLWLPSKDDPNTNPEDGFTIKRTAETSVEDE